MRTALQGQVSPDRLQILIAEVLDVAANEVVDSTSPENLPAWDSLNHLNIVMAIESEFGVILSAEAAIEMRSVALIRSVLARQNIQV